MKVEPGQVWQDNDRRNYFPNGYRTVRIKEVDLGMLMVLLSKVVNVLGFYSVVLILIQAPDIF